MYRSALINKTKGSHVEGTGKTLELNGMQILLAFLVLWQVKCLRFQLLPLKLNFQSVWICVCFPSSWDYSVPVLPMGQHVQSASHAPAYSVPSCLPWQLGTRSRAPAYLFHHPPSSFVLSWGGPGVVACKFPESFTQPDFHKQHHQHRHRPATCVNAAALLPQGGGYSSQGVIANALAGQRGLSRKPCSALLCQNWVWQS